MSRLAVAVLGATIAVVGAFAAPAAALTEARIVEVTCTGLTVVQTGVPRAIRFDVEAIDAATGTVLTERRTRSSGSGRLRIRLHTHLRGVHRLHAEVQRVGVRNAEYGEADVDLDRRCRVVGQRPATAAPMPTPAATPSAAPHSLRSRAGSVIWVVVAGAVGLATAAGYGAIAQRRRKLRS